MGPGAEGSGWGCGIDGDGVGEGGEGEGCVCVRRILPPSLFLSNRFLPQIQATGLIRPSRCKNYKVANFYPARAIAAASVWATMPAYNSDFTHWLEYVTGGKVDGADCGEIMDELEK